MSNIDKRALRKKLNRRLNDAFGFQRTSGGKHTTISLSIDECKSVLVALDELEAKDRRIAEQADVIAKQEKWIRGIEEAMITATDRAEAAEKRIAELSHHLQCAHAFVEHTEAFGHAASNGILCCGDAQWNIDASKSALAAAGKGAKLYAHSSQLHHASLLRLQDLYRRIVARSRVWRVRR